MNKFLRVLVVFYMSVTLFSMQAMALEHKAAKMSDKDILRALMKNLDISLADSAHCNNVGTDPSDHTIGDYLSGFWAFHTNQTGKNWLEVNSTKDKRGGLMARVMIYRADGEENWGWGVSFRVDERGKVDRKSVTCLGGG
jgi:hypothetical protein